MDPHLFAAVRPISRFHTEFRGSRDTDEQYLRRRGSDQHSGDHRNGSEKNKADEKQNHIMRDNNKHKTDESGDMNLCDYIAQNLLRSEALQKWQKEKLGVVTKDAKTSTSFGARYIGR